MIINKSMALMLIMIVCAGSSLFGGDEVGKINFLKGKAEITRNGKVMSGRIVKEGASIENYDLVRTSKNTEVSIIITSPLCPETVLTIDANTAVSIEINKLAKKSTTTLDMLAGGIALKVNRLAGNQDLSVRSSGAALGVRGTNFTVASSPDGDLLVACDEGKVEVNDGSGTTANAVPGTVVEQAAGEEIREVPVNVGTLKKFRRDWIAGKVSAFKANPARAMKNFANLYIGMVDRFNTAFDSLMEREAVLGKWMKEEDEKKSGGNMEIIREKKEVIRDLLAIRRILFLFEKIYYRVDELHSYFQAGVGKSVAISSSLSAAQFFTRFEEEREDLAIKVAFVKFVTKLYAKRNGGEFPIDNFDLEGDEDEGNIIEQGEDDFFDED